MYGSLRRSISRRTSGRDPAPGGRAGLSASVLPGERAAALATGAAGFLAKPYRSAELIESVTSLLDGRTTDAE